MNENLQPKEQKKIKRSKGIASFFFFNFKIMFFNNFNNKNLFLMSYISEYYKRKFNVIIGKCFKKNLTNRFGQDSEGLRLSRNESKNLASLLILFIEF